MADWYKELTPKHIDFIGEQHLFFTASAPIEGSHVNLSPKGMDTFRCLDPKTVAYLDLTGSGNETAAHLIENGRLTIMFCSFGPSPLIMRIYGRGRSVQPGDAEWDSLAGRFEIFTGARQIIVLEIADVQTSCGYAVPRYTYDAERPTLVKWSTAQGDDGLRAYRREKNTLSNDGLPTGLRVE